LSVEFDLAEEIIIHTQLFKKELKIMEKWRKILD